VFQEDIILRETQSQRM